MNKFGEQLAKVRKEHHVKQYELADVMGVTQSSISSWEVGRTEPTLEQLVALANYFNMSADDLLGRSPRIVWGA